MIMTSVVSVIFDDDFAHDVFNGNNYQMPVLYWDGEELAQSMAIARFVARKVNLFPF